MKKYKVHFSIFNLFADSQAEVVKLQSIFKGIMSVIVGTTWYGTNATYALYVAILGAVIDASLACFYFEEVNNEEVK
jgi:hypothetical protein